MMATVRVLAVEFASPWMPLSNKKKHDGVTGAGDLVFVSF
jgi:hypothetical protein